MVCLEEDGSPGGFCAAALFLIRNRREMREDGSHV